MRNWFLGAFIFAVTGCGWFGNEEMVGRLETGSSKLTQVPDGLETPIYVEMMPIPEIQDPRGCTSLMRSTLVLQCVASINSYTGAGNKEELGKNTHA